MPGYVSPYLWPETLIDFTHGSRKSHSRCGCRNGATNPPLAASTCSGTSAPFAALYAAIASWIAPIGSYSPVNVVPRIATTPIVFSSSAPTTCSGVIAYRPGAIGR